MEWIVAQVLDSRTESLFIFLNAAIFFRNGLKEIEILKTCHTLKSFSPECLTGIQRYGN
jgi:hypothetical protein